MSPVPVHHETHVYIAGTEAAEGPHHWFETIDPLLLPAVGERWVPDDWPAAEFRYPQPPDEGLFVIDRTTKVQADPGSRMLCRTTVTLGPGPAPESAELRAALEAADFERMRANFAEGVAYSMALLVEDGLMRRCADQVASAMKTEPARGLDDDPTVSAWVEAARVMQADDHMLADQVRSDVAGRASGALDELDRAEALALWLTVENEQESGCISELVRDCDVEWLSAFDPRLHFDRMSETVDRLTRRLLGRLRDEALGL